MIVRESVLLMVRVSAMRRMRVMMIKSCVLFVDMVMIRVMMRVIVTKRNVCFRLPWFSS